MLYYLSSYAGLIPSNNGISTEIFVEDILNELANHDLIALDTETTGLSPFSDDVVMLQFGTPNDQFVVDTRGISPQVFKELLEDPSKTFVIHNAKFDYNMLKQYDIVLSNVYCTQLAEIVINNGKYTMDEIKRMKVFSLKSTYHRYTGTDISKEEQTSFIHHDGPFTIKQILYAANDVVYCREVYDHQQPIIKDLKLEACVQLENEACLAFADMEYNGIRLDVHAWAALAASNQEKLAAAMADLDAELFKQPKKKVSKYELTEWQPRLFEQDWVPRKCTVNWGSSQQVLEILQSVYGVEPTDKHGKISTGSQALFFLKNRPEIVKKLLAYREKAKEVSTYGMKFVEKHLHDDGKIHTTYNQIVETGRCSSRDPNMQNIPGLFAFRQCFTADPGYVLITGDYSAQEPRTTADKCGDPSLIEFFLTGHGDYHSMVTSKMYSTITGEEIHIPPKIDGNEEALKKHYAHPFAKYRPVGKQTGLKLDYGGSAFTLKDTLGVSEEEAQEFVDAYWAAFPQKKKYFDKCSKFGLRYGFIRTNNVTGRIRYFKEFEPYNAIMQQKKSGAKLTRDDYRDAMKLRGSIERQSGNTTIQGTAGDMTKTALVFIRRELMQYGEAARILLQVHDEIVVMAKEEIATEVAKKVQDCMVRAGKVYCPRVPMKVEPNIEFCWNH